MSEIEYTTVSNPHIWDASAGVLKVGDTFTEEWLERMRWLMSAFNNAQALLREASLVLERHETSDSGDDSYNNDDVIAMHAKIKKFLAPE